MSNANVKDINKAIHHLVQARVHLLNIEDASEALARIYFSLMMDTIGTQLHNLMTYKTSLDGKDYTDDEDEEEVPGEAP